MHIITELPFILAFQKLWANKWGRRLLLLLFSFNNVVNQCKYGKTKNEGHVVNVSVHGHAINSV